MRRPRPRLLTVIVVAVLSIAIGFLLAYATGQYVGVFTAQVVVAGLLATWWAKPKKDSAPQK
jgi:drug/metabolite transporter (DMT)-like permease